MRKSFIYGIVLTTAFLSGCKGDYDDWAAPQGFDAEEAKNINVNITPAAGIEMENVTTDYSAFYCVGRCSGRYGSYCL